MRPAQIFVSEMNKYSSEVRIVSDGKIIDGKSILSVMAGGIKCGSVLRIECRGADERDMLKAAANMLENRVGDELC